MTRERDRRRRQEVLEDDDDCVSRLPEYVSACAATWQAALPERVPPTHICGIVGRRAAALIAGTAVPSRSEVSTLDHALGTDTARYLPPVRSASLQGMQRAPAPSAEKRVVAEEHITAWLRKPRATKAKAQKKSRFTSSPNHKVTNS